MARDKNDSGDGYLNKLTEVAKADVDSLIKSQFSYGDSWKARGGVGAFMMLARKWDRLENQLGSQPKGAGAPGQYDIFAHVMHDPRPEGVIDDIRDLRRYLVLVEAEVLARLNAPVHQSAQELIDETVDERGHLKGDSIY